MKAQTLTSSLKTWAMTTGAAVVSLALTVGALASPPIAVSNANLGRIAPVANGTTTDYPREVMGYDTFPNAFTYLDPSGTINEYGDDVGLVRSGKVLRAAFWYQPVPDGKYAFDATVRLYYNDGLHTPGNGATLMHEFVIKNLVTTPGYSTQTSYTFPVATPWGVNVSQDLLMTVKFSDARIAPIVSNGHSTGYSSNEIMINGNKLFLPGAQEANMAFQIGLADVFTSYTASVEGACPGKVMVSWEGAEPGKAHALMVSMGKGNYIIPPGHPCAGTQLGLSSDGLLLLDPPGFISTGKGSGSIVGIMGTTPCRAYAQWITRGSCATSNIVRLP